MELSGDWEFYNCDMDGARCMVFVRVDLMDSAPDASRPAMLLVVLNVKSKRADGLTNEPETTYLQEVERTLDRELADAWSAVYVARYTKAGERTMAYYLPNEPDRTVLDAIVTRCAPGYTYRIESHPDEKWENYRDILYPNDKAWLEIGNRPVLDRLSDAGDPLKPERHTLHWLYFNGRRQRDGFIKALRSHGAKFDVVEPLEPDADFEKYGVRLEHQCSMQTWALIGAQLPIIRLAQEFNGEYDGFECAQVPDRDSERDA
jgi:hypothetical protein